MDAAMVPDALLHALQHDNLVVFAGAGVSMGAPTGLPSFDGLAEQLANGIGFQHKLRKGAAIDAYLGALDESCSVDLHRLTGEILEGRSDQPNGLHRAICELGLVSTLRVVTTNYDRCFQEALRSMGVPFREYVAPVLPLGDAFDGVVQLHGQVPLAPDGGLVLTDRDFGTAYVFRGWATEFLTSMFSKYTVVFIGYSGNDTIMRYLTRALPRGREHFAFTPPSGEASWSSLGITPIPYPTDNNHEALQVAVEELAARASQDHVTHAQRIGRIVKKGFPLTPADESYIRGVCSRIETLRIFADVAEPSAWLDWVITGSMIEDLFEINAPLDFDKALVWSEWVCRSVFSPAPFAVLKLVNDHGGIFPEALWWALWRALFMQYPQAVVAGQYLTLLMDSAGTAGQRRQLSMLFSKIADIDTDGAIRLLVRSLEPKPQFAPYVPDILAYEDFGLQLDFRTFGNDDEIRAGWAKLEPLLSSAQRLSLLITSIAYLESASKASRHSMKADWRQDIISGSRNLIDGDEIDRNRLGVGVLIDVCRDLLVDICRDGQKHVGGASKVAIGTLNLLLRSEFPICQRLGLHALAKTGVLAADCVLDLIIELGMLFDYRLNLELQQVLSSSVRHSSNDAKRLVVHHVLTYPLEATDNTELERYRVLSRLQDSDPGNRPISEALARLREANPGLLPLHASTRRGRSSDLSPFRDEPLYEPSGVLRGASPNDIAAAVSQWHSKPAEPAPDWLSELRFRAGEEQTWAIDVLAELSTCETWTTTVWEALLEGIADHPLADASSILRSVDPNPDKEALAPAIFDALSSAWGREGWVEIPKAVMESELSLLFELWRKVEGEAPWVLDIDSESPTLRHLTDPRGTFAYLYLFRLEQLNYISTGRQFSELIRSQLTAMLGRGAKDLDATLVLFGQSAGFLAKGDKLWARQGLIRLFDWRRHPAEAPLMWRGFFSQGAWNGYWPRGGEQSPLALRLEPLMRVALPWMRENLPSDVDRYIFNHALLYAFGLGDAQEIQWADPLLVNVSPAELGTWIEAIGRNLRTDRPAVAAMRERLSQFWLRRIRGLPTPMSGAESAALSSWLVASEDAFIAFQEQFMNSPAPQPIDDQTPRGLIDIDSLPVMAYPLETARVLTKLLKGVTNGYWLFERARRIGQQLQKNGHSAAAAGIFEQLLRLGDSESLSLVSRNTQSTL
ncbi:SIR2 family protein [Arthrobacter bambusae]